MASGVKINDDIKKAITEIQMEKKFKYLIFRCTDDMKEVVCEKRAGKETKFDEFLEDMKTAEHAGQCRWAVVDVEYQTKSGMDKKKLVYVFWAPDGCPVKQKMIYAASNDAVKKAIGNSVGVFVQANDFDELTLSELQGKILQTDRA